MVWTLVLSVLSAVPAWGNGPGLQTKVQGFGWLVAGRVMRSTDSLNYNFNGNWMQNAAAQITANIIVDEHWDGALGIGIGQAHAMQGTTSDAFRLSMDIATYISEARFSYTIGPRDAPKFRLTSGYFAFNYNPNVKNLGLYLLRGPVYPGILMSGFEANETLDIAHILGFQLHSTIGPLKQDLILNMETEIKPLLDISPAYVARLSMGDVFNMGAGVNFYHLIPVVSKAHTNPRDPELFTFGPKGVVNHPYERLFVYIDPESIDSTVLDDSGNEVPQSVIDSAVNTGVSYRRFANDIDGEVLYTGDTTWLSHSGVKLTAFFGFDPKPLIKADIFGPNDLILYGEVGIIGVKNYKGIYDDITKRIPVMLGFNLPTFKLLDNLSVEVEYYGAPWKGDLDKIQNLFSPIPVSNKDIERRPYAIIDTATGDTIKTVIATEGNEVHENVPWGSPYDAENMTTDNWKWSIHASKTIKDHIRISAQVASDHFRPSGTALTPTYFEIFTTPTDWYWMAKLTYFF